MKRLISHRGNIFGSNQNKENSPEYIETAIKAGFDVEIDVWLIDSIFYLGHDKPIYRTSENFLVDHHLWCHAKNIDALNKMLLSGNIHCFYHSNDDAILTSKNFIWVYPGKEMPKQQGIAVLPEQAKDWDISSAVGICSDYIQEY